MKAIAIHQFGNTEVFEEIELPQPRVIPGHVLIKVAATSVNPLDYKLRSGVFPDLVKFPAILHGDVAGTIEEIGAEVHGFAVGDEVYGCVGGLLEMSGGLAEYVVADANLIAHKPKSLSLTQAAALPLVALTAWEGLITYAKVREGQTVLIHGGTGGVGHLAVQLAKARGARVFATCSSANKMAVVKELGADEAINYKTTDVKSYVEQLTQGAGFNIVFDTVGGQTLNDSFEAAALFGNVISILAVGNYDLTPAFLKGVSLHMIMQPLPLITGQRRADYHMILTEVANLVDAGKIKPLIDSNVFLLQHVGKAHHHLEQGQAMGKVIVTHN